MSAAGPRRVVLVPGVLALLPEYAGIEDPVAELRAAAEAAVGWLAESGAAVEVRATAQGHRIAAHLLGRAGATAMEPGSAGPLLVVANGSATRTEKAPGYLDPRAEAFDEELRQAILAADPVRLRALDPALAEELWADVAALGALADAVEPGTDVRIDYDQAPFGVQYWVARFGAGD